MTTLDSGHLKRFLPLVRPKRAHYVGLFVVTALSLCLRFFMLGHQSLWIDEGYSLYFSDGESFGVVLNRLLESGESDRFRVLFYFILYFWRGLFGDSEMAVRSLPALFGFAATILTYTAARNSFSKARSLWSFGLISVSAYCVFYSQELRDYSMLMAISAAQLLCLSSALTSTDQTQTDTNLKSLQWARWSFVLLTILGLFANILSVYYTAALATAHLLTRPRFKRWLSWWLPVTGLSLLPGYFYLSAPTLSSPETITTGRLQSSIFQHFGYSIYGFLSGLTYGPPQVLLRGEDRLQTLVQYWPLLVLLLAVGMGLGLMLIALMLRRWTALPGPVDRLLFYTLLFTLLFSLGFVYFTQMRWLPRHLCYLWPAFALLVPALLEKAKAGVATQAVGARWKVKAAQICLSLFVFINAIALHNYYFNEQYYRDDFRAAAAYVLRNREPNQVSVLVGGTGDNYLLEYYNDTETLNGVTIKPSADQSLAEQLETLTNGADQVLLVANRAFYRYGSSSALEQDISTRYQVEKAAEFLYFQIYQLQQLPQGNAPIISSVLPSSVPSP
ncbi:MAG: glycosyltransferase family 39 protein [Cyanobacteria bacterium P01_D01_bin.1]